jgi:hypothetical protein
MFHNRIASTAFRDSPCLRFAGHGAAIVMLALGMSNVATATTYFNLASVPGPSPSASINFMDNELTTDFEGFYYDYVYLSTASGSTMMATTPAGASLGTYAMNGSISEPNAYLSYPAGDTVSARLNGGVYYEHYHALGYFTNFLYSSSNGSLLSGTLDGFSIYASPGTNAATIELDLTNATSAVVSGLPSNLYVDFTGTTSKPVSLSTIVYSRTVSLLTFGSMTLDLSGTVSDTPYSPTTVPLPASAWLLLSGLGGVGLLSRRRSVKLDAA